MRLIIDIPEDDYELVQKYIFPQRVLYEIVHGTPLNGTNGDVIKAVFPNDSMNFLIVNMERNDWWNADYKGVE